jgi:hypothetical protein
MKSLPIRLLALAGILGFGAHASAQSFNLDAGDQISPYGLPSTSHGAAASQTGTWVNIGFNPGTTAALADVSGAPTSVTLTHTVGSSFTANFLNLSGEPTKLMCDIVDTGPTTTTYTFNNLASGDYSVYTYAWAPDDDTFRTLVTPGPGALEPAVIVGGTWPGGAYVQNVTHALHHFPGVSNGTISITLGVQLGAGTLNGFQLKRTASAPVPTPFCFGDGSGTACPCGNVGATGNGCPNSVNAAGANLAATGVASIAADTLSLNGSGMPNSSALYFQGTTQVSGGALFGDGLRCAGGAIMRLGTKINAAGVSSYPGGSTPISVRGSNAAGNVRTYQCWYRNADVAFCPPATFNLTNGMSVTWLP